MRPQVLLNQCLGFRPIRILGGLNGLINPVPQLQLHRVVRHDLNFIVVLVPDLGPPEHRRAVRLLAQLVLEPAHIVVNALLRL